jgi:cytochrome c oxidase subunit 2
MRPDTDKPTLIALALVAALSMYTGLVRGPGDDEVLAQVLRSFTAARPNVVQLAAVPVAHGDEGLHPEVINIRVSKLRITPNHITLKKGQPATLILSSDNRAHRFLLRALNIDANVLPAKTTAVTVTPQVAGTFKAICDHCGRSGHPDMKMTVVVE